MCRPRVEPSFNPTVVDRMYRIPDAASFAALYYLERHLGRRCGGSTGTNLIATLSLITEMKKAGQTGSVVTLLCDGGDRYRDTYYNPDWIKEQNIDLAPWISALEQFDATGLFEMPLDHKIGYARR
eukprot:NODE_10905_length_475_cov_1.422414_g10882_i0.p1 GENE.NODE_10905_length_475_cov_1.422414_g10882_i0~~NODE_10905_length_475_cov_1.422414_g10882_i0.p1  ORF type:complete len:126 (+),score=14.07 NODE_10905_length_475_cov_1.422414_g10882_i0:3-380(+)